jgi:hypothetical protein
MGQTMAIARQLDGCCGLGEKRRAAEAQRRRVSIRVGDAIHMRSVSPARTQF